jgi:hypothetical protein
MLSGLFELLSKCAEVWKQNPVPAAVAVAVGLIIGYFLSRLRHQGRIDTLNERINQRNDVIDFKDKTIQDISEKTKTVPEEAGPKSSKASDNNKQLGPPSGNKHPVSTAEESATKVHFRTLNAQITWDAEHRIKNALSNARFKFIFNPTTGASKFVTFLSDGSIGEGRNQNEATWRIVNGRLEILNSDGEIYSRFIILKDDRSFHHTNDPDTLSIRGQFFVAA